MRSAYIFAAALSLVVATGNAQQVKKGSVTAPKIKVAAPPAVLYDFKGVPLEISIDEFRKLPHPDGLSDTAVFCTGDKTTDGLLSSVSVATSVDNDQKKLGIVKCVWENTSQNFLRPKGSTTELELANTGYAIRDYRFLFLPDPKDQVLRLYRFQGTSNAAAVPEVIQAITKKFVPPKIDAAEVQNRIGNKFDQTTATWENTLAVLVVQDRATTVNDMLILMFDKRLQKVIDDAAAAAKAQVRNPI